VTYATIAEALNAAAQKARREREARADSLRQIAIEAHAALLEKRMALPLLGKPKLASSELLMAQRRYRLCSALLLKFPDDASLRSQAELARLDLVRLTNKIT
jgi:hypothetical protein